MITTLKNWADINGADALIQIGRATATVQVCTPSCDDSGSGGAIAETFFGGLIYSRNYTGGYTCGHCLVSDNIQHRHCKDIQ